MILFLGDSFTWGQGLHYYYLIENEGWTWDTCRKFIGENQLTRFEKLGFGADEFRRQNSFPYLVSKSLNLPMITPRFENGGDNYATYDILDNLHLFVTNTNVNKVVIQFSSPTRRIEDDVNYKKDSVENIIENQIYQIDMRCQQLNISWYGLSWFKEMGIILKQNYPDNFIPILYKGKEYESFDYQEHLSLIDLTIQYTENINDGHFNLEGHQVIANSILTKIKSI